MTSRLVTPDGFDVVWTLHDVTERTHPPLLVVDAIDAYLDTIGFSPGALSWRRIGDGQSNVTFELLRGDDRVVLRRPPRPPLPPSAHDVLREARIQRTLESRGMPVPHIRAVCDDAAVIGVPFYLMDFVDGDVLTDTLPPQYGAPDRRAATAFAAIDTLAELHAVPLEGDVAALGRPHGYLHRQVERFRALWSLNSRRDIPRVDDLAERLLATLPVTYRSSVVHGDYRFGNLMFAHPGRIAVVLDWEMATLGDPLADLGYFTATYSEPGRPPTVMDLTPVTAGSGFPSSGELVDRYAARTGLSTERLAWYEALALWKAAIFCEAMYTRWLDGQRPDDEFAPRLHSGVPDLLGVAEMKLSRDRC